MDIVIPLLFMALFYLGPTLLKRYRATGNTPPVVPELLNYEQIDASLEITEIASIASATELRSTMVVDKVQQAPGIVEEQSAWQGKLDQNIITNGVIFAEILQAPRAYRPFVRR